jgi:pimeloyl-ACP methyl ester carboxylesterase
MPSQPVAKHLQTSSVNLSYFEWGRSGDPVVLLVHATGFHGRIWDETVKRLDGWHVYAIELRGHGRSDKRSPYDWPTFGDDLAEFISLLGLGQIVGVGHSLGGYALTYAAAQMPDRFKRLVLVDPVIFEPDAYAEDRYGLSEVEDSPVSRRRELWSGWQAMVERFADRHPYSLWVDQTLEDYCRFGLIETEDGYRLACPAKVEATVYMGHSRVDIYDRLKNITAPVVVLRAYKEAIKPERIDFSLSPTWEHLAERFPNGRDVYLPHLTHFIPMQDPDLVARFIMDPDADFDLDVASP